MTVKSMLRKLFTVDDGILDEQFSLEDQGESSQKTEEDAESDKAVEFADVDRFRAQHDDGDPTRVEMPVRRPITMTDLVRRADETGKTAVKSEYIPADIEESKAILKDIFHLPENKDIVIREFVIGTEVPTRALAVFVDGMSDKNIINSHILQPLMLITRLTHEEIHRKMEVVEEALLPGNQVVKTKKWDEVTPGILSGSTAVFVDGCDSALIVESKGWEHRTVGISQTESVVRGPHDAFTESFRANTGLVRSRLRSEHLITEMLSVGKLGRTDVAIMYVHGVANTQVVDEVKRRIEAVNVDYLADSGLLEQFIDDNPYVMIPQVFSTERPDRIAHMLVEGHVAIFVGNNPYVLAVPVVFWTLMQSPEDAYLRWPFGTFLRLIRWIALAAAILMPGFYVAITNYHPEMIPTDLMLAIAGSREQVPFPVVVEVLMMEFAIELIREAGIRIPSVIGPTIGIVGALIIGQAAVQAGVVSPLLVIVIAITALASFSVPNYNLSFSIRVLRFVFLLFGATFGFYGITLLLCVVLARLTVQKSFGVPMFAPVTPSMDASPDVFRRGPAFTMNERPAHLHTKKKWREKPHTRTWKKSEKSKGKPGDGQGRDSE